MTSQRLAVFYHGEDKILRYKIKDGDRWVDGHGLEGHGCWRRPSAVNYRGVPHVFCQGAEGGNLWRSAYYDGHWETAQVPGVVDLKSTAGPSAVVHNDAIWVFHNRGGDSKYTGLWYTIYDGSQWIPDVELPDTNLDFGPSAVEYRGAIHVFHGGTRTGRPLWMNVWDDQSNWHGDKQISDAALFRSPGAVVYKDRIWVFHHDLQDSGGLFYVHQRVHSMTWTNDRAVPNVRLSESPSPIVVGEDLLVFHQGGYMNGELWCTKVNDPVSSTQVPGVAMQCSPCPILLPG